MTPTEQAARVLEGVPRRYDFDPQYDYLREDHTLAAIARHLAPGDELVERAEKLMAGFELTRMTIKPDKGRIEAVEIITDLLARISALTATVGDYAGKALMAEQGEQSARQDLQAERAENATMRDRLARMGKTYWLLRSFATHDDSCKLNKPPKFEGPCSCGLAKALADGEIDAALTETPADGGSNG